MKKTPKAAQAITTALQIERHIMLIRGEKVILDTDLASLSRIIHDPTVARGFQTVKMGRFATECSGIVLTRTVSMRDRVKRRRFGVWEHHSRSGHE